MAIYKKRLDAKKAALRAADAASTIFRAYVPVWESATGTTANMYTWSINCDTGTAATTWDQLTAINHIITANGISVGWATNGHAVPVKPAAPPLLNHLGKPARSFDKDKQFADAHPAEIVALQLLRRMIPPDDFRHYLRHGFISVRGASGLVYQIYREYHRRIVVRERGEVLAQLCVHLNGGGRTIPPTDEVVGKKLIVECDEPGIWKRSNVSWATQNRARRPLELVGMAA